MKRERTGGEEGPNRAGSQKGEERPEGLGAVLGGQPGPPGPKSLPPASPPAWLLRQDLHFTPFPCPLPPPRGSPLSPHPQSPPATQCFTVWVLLPAKTQSNWELTR